MGKKKVVVEEDGDAEEIEIRPSKDDREFQKLSDRDHMLLRPDMYVGALIADGSRRDIWVMNEEHQCSKTTTETALAFEQVAILELLSNAIDATRLAIEKGHKVPPIQVAMSKKWLSVQNGGFPIPVRKHPKYDIYMPQLLLANLRTSSNYNDNRVRTEGGRNGVGVKCVNVYSRVFQVEIFDVENEKYYYQECRDNMGIIDPPTIEPYNGKESSIRIRFKLDFKRFGLRSYPEEAAGIFRRHCFDAAYTSGVDVSFQYGKEEPELFSFAPNDSFAHGKAYFDLEEQEHLCLYRWPEEAKVVRHKDGTESATFGDGREKKKIDPLVRILVVDTPNSGKAISFVNGLFTRDGGIHVDVVYETLRPLLDAINSGKKRILLKPPVAGKKPDTKKDAPKLNISEIKKHLSIIVVAWVGNPTFSSQSKVRLDGCKNRDVLKPVVENSKLNKMLQWQFADEMRESLHDKNLKKLNVKPIKGRRDKNLQDANHAGTKDRKGTVLVLCEGGSASGYVTVMMQGKMRDKMGLRPLKGKTLNTIDVAYDRLDKNAEISAIVRALGLQYGMDYSLPENYKKLRYDSVMIVTDADPDGDHIKALLIAFFYRYWPQLFNPDVQYVLCWLSPLYRASKGKTQLSFYDDVSFKIWQEEENTKGWKIAYSKGLGSNTREQALYDFHHSRQVVFVGDEKADESINLAFGNKGGNGSQLRKTWLQDMREYRSKRCKVMPIKGVNLEEAEEHVCRFITDFIHTDHRKFSRFNLSRALPAIDGLKPSERKIVYGSLLYFKYGRANHDVEVVTLGGYIKQQVAYHSGEKALHDSISLSATVYVSWGMNNLPILTARSLIGDRGLGKDAIPSPRYAKVCMANWLPYVYLEEDMELLPEMYDNGKRIEPEFLLPVFPLHLANGVIGIGTGWSTDIPNFHPMHILEALRWMLNRQLSGRSTTMSKATPSEPLAHRGPDIQPYYRGFLGEVEVVTTKPRGSDAMRVDVKTYGVMKYSTSRNEVRITELPVSMVCRDYRSKLDTFCDNGAISKYIDHSNDVKVDFTLRGIDEGKLRPVEVSQKSLGLVDTNSMNNMHLIEYDGDERNVKKYPNPHAILDDFYRQRFPWYETRYNARMRRFQKELDALNDKIRFYRAVLSAHFHEKGTTTPEQAAMLEYVPLETMMRSEQDIRADMEAYEPPIPYQIYLDTPHRNFSLERLKLMEKELRTIQEKLDNLRELQPADLWKQDLDELENMWRRARLL